jgi:hypothetical protein
MNGGKKKKIADFKASTAAEKVLSIHLYQANYMKPKDPIQLTSRNRDREGQGVMLKTPY